MFESYTETALMFGASPRLATRLDFATIRDVALLIQTSHFFVVDLSCLIVTKLAYFTARCPLATSALASFPTWGTFRSSLHRLFSSVSKRISLPQSQGNSSPASGAKLSTG